MLPRRSRAWAKRDRRKVASDLNKILEHLIKWRYQPEKRKTGWRGSIREHRDRIARVLADSPSLKRLPREVLAEEYRKARAAALEDTGLPEDRIPSAAPSRPRRYSTRDFGPSRTRLICDAVEPVRQVADAGEDRVGVRRQIFAAAVAGEDADCRACPGGAGHVEVVEIVADHDDFRRTRADRRGEGMDDVAGGFRPRDRIVTEDVRQICAAPTPASAILAASVPSLVATPSP